ncbi:hypothetical protein ABW19_dt0200240 [Dactylella cylindrospora]|nr:hypothetical protein ABW19_dt0200240 [Dactylella cylindrospora]
MAVRDLPQGISLLSTKSPSIGNGAWWDKSAVSLSVAQRVIRSDVNALAAGNHDVQGSAARAKGNGSIVSGWAGTSWNWWGWAVGGWRGADIELATGGIDAAKVDWRGGAEGHHGEGGNFSWLGGIPTLWEGRDGGDSREKGSKSELHFEKYEIFLLRYIKFCE